MKKFLSFFLALSISLSAFFSSFIPVHASPNSVLQLDWSIGDKVEFFFTHFSAIASQAIGLYLNPSMLASGTIRDMIFNYLHDQNSALNSDSFDDYIDNHFKVEENSETGALQANIDATLSDDLHDALLEYLKNNTGFVYYDTVSSSYSMDATMFKTPASLNYFSNYISATASDNCLLSVFSYYSTYNSRWEFELKQIPISLDSSGNCFVVGNIDSCSNDYGNVNAYYCDTWSPASDNVTFIVHDGYMSSELMGSGKYASSSTSQSVYLSLSSPFKSDDHFVALFSKSGIPIKIYRTLDDYKSFNYNEVPYYVTSKWLNYVPGDGNTITQQEFNAPVTYGDINNGVTEYITNNGGITDEQLQKIIDAILKAHENDSGSGGSGGDDSGGGSSGGGLSGLLAGLGALGDVILSILGKLSEYLGKAMALFSDVVLGIIDKVPKGFTDLLSAFFPFIPEEWTAAIGLGIVLTIILGIVRIFKK